VHRIKLIEGKGNHALCVGYHTDDGAGRRLTHGQFYRRGALLGFTAFSRNRA